MALISRPHDYVSGATIDPAEVTAVEDTLYDAINGGLDETNFSDTTQIPSDYLATIDVSRIDDVAANVTQFRTTRSGGDSGAISLPTSMAHELYTLRGRILSRGRLRMAADGSSGGGATFIDDSNTLTSGSWAEAGVVNTGRNLLPNNGFEVKTTGATAAPDGWELHGSPSNCTIVTTAQDTIGSAKRGLNITNDAADEGIKCTVKGLKASTKYLIGIAYVRTAGTVKLATTGGLGAGNDYQNFSYTDSASSAGTLNNYQFMVKTDTSGTDLVVYLSLSSGAGGDFTIYSCWMYELNDYNQGELPLLPTQVATYSTADETYTNAGAGSWTEISELTINQYVPYWGYRFRYQVTLCFKSFTIAGTQQTFEYAFRIRRDIDSSGSPTEVEGPYAWRVNSQSSGEFQGGIVNMEYVLDNPTPGSTYNFTTELYIEGDGAGVANTITFNPTVGTTTPDATQSRARLIVERM